MRCLSLVLLSVLLFGCAAQGYRTASLEKYLPDRGDSFGIRFTYGPWHAPGSLLVYDFDGSSLRVISGLDGSEVTQTNVTVSDCVEIPHQVAELDLAIKRSVDFFVKLSAEKRPIPDIVTLDGPLYTIDRHYFDAWSRVSLEGGDNARRLVPWIDAAWQLIDVGLNCSEQ